MSIPRLLRITTVPQSLTLLLEGQLNFFQQQGFEVLAVSAGGTEVQTLKAQGINHVAVNLTRKITPVKDLLALVNLIVIIRKFNPNIVHTHTPKAGLLGMLAAWLCRVPVRMHTVAGLPLMEAKGFKRAILKLTEQITYRCATRVYPNSIGLLDFINSQFTIHNLQFTIIGNGSSNGIDVHYFSRTPEVEREAQWIRNKYSIKEQEAVFCFVGRVVRDKGIVELAQAFQQLENQHPIRLLVVGPLEQDLDPIPAETLLYLTANQKVILAGFQKDVRPWLAVANVFVFPSYREGFPNVVMQAMCMEVPCIVSDINGCNELIKNNQTGLIVPAKNVDKLQAAMQWTIDQSCESKAMAIQARNHVVERFSRAYVWEKLLEEYKKQLKA
jgi:glycosyltransferase involved in cell wall biosynthesis